MASTSDADSLIHRPRPKPAMQLPTVCVSSLGDSLQQQQQQQFATTFNNLLAATTLPTQTAVDSPLVSPVFVDVASNTENPHVFRMASGGATSAMLHDRFFAYRHERNSSSSSDSGLAFPFSPPHTLGLSSPSLSLSISPISPPGLSPLQISTDSAFSTPAAETGKPIRSHFTFDHLPSPNLQRKEDPPTSLDQLTLTELLLRRVSDQQRLQDQLAAAINASSNTLQPNKTAVFRSESLPTVQPPQQQTDMEKLLHNFNLIQQALSAPQPPNHTPIGRTASLNTNISAANANIPVFIAPQPPAFTKQQPLLLQRPPLKATCSSPLNATSGGGLHRTESTKRKLLKSGGSKDGEEPKSKNVATDAVDGNEEDRQFMCRFCNKDFRRPDILSRHLRRHTGEKPFMCDCCGRNFSRSDHLRTHRRTHTNEKPYNCTECHYSARRRDVLTRHMATRHQKKAGPSSFSQRRGRRAATQQPIPKSPLAAKDEPATKTENEDSGSDCEDSNVIIDVTNVDSDEEEPHGDENENLDSKKEVVVVEGEKSDDIQVTSI